MISGLNSQILEPLHACKLCEKGLGWIFSCFFAAVVGFFFFAYVIVVFLFVVTFHFLWKFLYCISLFWLNFFFFSNIKGIEKSYCGLGVVKNEHDMMI